MCLNEFGFVCLVLMSAGINRFHEYGMATKWCMTVKEYESVPYAAHLKWGPRSITLWNQLPTTFTTTDTVDGFKSMIPVSASIPIFTLVIGTDCKCSLQIQLPYDHGHDGPLHDTSLFFFTFLAVLHY
jgi:hypothetical protein